MIGEFGNIGNIGGIRVMANPVIPETEIAPKKKHKEKPWMTGRKYHDRIQKKWLKRFGVETVMPFFFIGPGIITANPKNIEALKVQISAR